MSCVSACPLGLLFQDATDFDCINLVCHTNRYIDESQMTNTNSPRQGDYMHSDFWSIFTAAALLLEVIPGLVVISLALETEKK